METVLIDSDSALLELMPSILSSPQVAIDTETTGLDHMKDIAVGLCLANRPDLGYYIPVGHRVGPQCSPGLVAYFAELLLRNPRINKVFHNAKYDLMILENSFGLETVGPIDDTLLMAYLFDNTIPKGLKELDSNLFEGHQHANEERLNDLKKQLRTKSMRDLSPAQVSAYGAGDALTTFRLREHLLPKIQDQLGVYSTELKLIPILIRTERRGMLVDPENLKRSGQFIDSVVPEKLAELRSIAGFDINPNSPPDAARLIYEVLGNKIKKLSDGGKPSTAEDTLLNLPPHRGIDLLLELRTLGKTRSTYVEGILNRLDTHNRIHGHLNQAGAETGRFSSSEPNLQNMPREGSVSVSIRQAFVPPPGFVLCFLDYSQVEMRMFAHRSRDPGLIQAVKSGFDFHLATAALIFELPPEEISEIQRKFAKRVNFGYIYGIGKSKLARELRISEVEAERFLQDYDRRFPGVPVFMNQARSDFEQNKYVMNCFGRKRFIPYNKAYRAVNTDIQGSAADIMKDSLTRVGPLLNQSHSFLINVIHDEFMMEIREDELDLIPEIKSTMERFHFRVPIVADVSWSAESWGRKLKGTPTSDRVRAEQQRLKGSVQ